MIIRSLPREKVNISSPYTDSTPTRFREIAPAHTTISRRAKMVQTQEQLETSLEKALGEPQDKSLLDKGLTTTGDIIEAYDNPHQFYENLIKDIDHAKERVYITNIIVSNKDKDEISRKLLDALKRAKERGVDVKVILDEFSTNHVDGMNTVKALREAGIPVKLMDTISLKRWVKGGDLVVSEHRKVFVVDNKAYTGGVCIRDLWYKNEYRDYMLELKGKVVEDLVKSMSKSWPTKKFIVHNQVKNKGNTPIEVIYTHDGDLTFKKKAIELINKAKKKIVIEHQYLVDEDIVNALIKARERGVDVTIVLPKNKDDFINDWIYIPISKDLVRPLQEKGAKIWRYVGNGNTHLLHSKLMVIDDRYVLTGSHNFDYLSTEHSHELSLLIDSPELAREMEDKIDEAIKQSEPETPPSLFKLIWAKVMRFLVKVSPVGPH